mmetsp:Transcript_21598/g.63867  ORF Transcript_21598/g.63867 Transcript_21598/m.63867 type:complete len:178 (+) Transcript_21598:23-556(+)
MRMRRDGRRAACGVRRAELVLLQLVLLQLVLPSYAIAILNQQLVRRAMRVSLSHRAGFLVAQQAEQPLGEEELQALAGVWRASLDLDDGQRDLTCHLDVSGRLTSSESDLPVWNANWQAAAVGEGGPVKLRMRLGNLQLSGKGERAGVLRCALVTGHVLEGDDEPVRAPRWIPSPPR